MAYCNNFWINFGRDDFGSNSIGRDERSLSVVSSKVVHLQMGKDSLNGARPYPVGLSLTTTIGRSVSPSGYGAHGPRGSGCASGDYQFKFHLLQAPLRLLTLSPPPQGVSYETGVPIQAAGVLCGPKGGKQSCSGASTSTAASFVIHEDSSWSLDSSASCRNAPPCSIDPSQARPKALPAPLGAVPQSPVKDRSRLRQRLDAHR